MPSPDGALDGTAGELNQAGTSCSRIPTKDLPGPPSTGGETRDLSIRNGRKLPLLLACSSLTDSLLRTTPLLLRRKIPLPEWEELPGLPPDLPPHPETNGMQQVNARDAQLLSLVLSEAMMGS